MNPKIHPKGAVGLKVDYVHHLRTARCDYRRDLDLHLDVDRLAVLYIEMLSLEASAGGCVRD